MPIEGSTATVHGLELTAESLGGRRNRVDTVLVRKVAPNDSGGERESVPDPVRAEPA